MDSIDPGERHMTAVELWLSISPEAHARRIVAEVMEERRRQRGEAFLRARALFGTSFSASRFGLIETKAAR